VTGDIRPGAAAGLGASGRELSAVAAESSPSMTSLGLPRATEAAAPRVAHKKSAAIIPFFNESLTSGAAIGSPPQKVNEFNTSRDRKWDRWRGSVSSTATS
jgi:hypothetical protein